MEVVDTGNEQIILVPDVNNNRIQVFKKDKSELIFYGQFGNLPFTSTRSLPIMIIKTHRYEPIHNTEEENLFLNQDAKILVNLIEKIIILVLKRKNI